MKYSFAIWTGATAAEPADYFFQGKLIAEDTVQFQLVLIEERIKSLGLGNRPWETVQEKTALTTKTADAFGHQSENSCIRDQVATPHELNGGNERGSQF